MQLLHCCQFLGQQRLRSRAVIVASMSVVAAGFCVVPSFGPKQAVPTINIAAIIETAIVIRMFRFLMITRVTGQ